MAVGSQRVWCWVENLARDVRYGVRGLRRNPVFTAVAVLTLALGIGANTAIFSLADAVLFRSLPVSNPQDLVVLRQRGPSGDIFPFTSVSAVNLDASRDVLTGLAAFRPVPGAHVTVNGETDLTLMQAVSGSYHGVLGLRVALGRTLTEQDREPVAVISHRYWQRRFAGDSNVVGRVLGIQGRPFTIVGVTLPEFYGTQPGRSVDVTVPLSAHTNQMPPNARWLYLIGRLAPSVSREQALAALRVHWAQLADPPPRPPVTLELDSGAQGLNELRREFSVPLRILMAAVGMVLLLACANLSGLLIVRASARQQEIGVRLSLGASRARVVRQLLTESALLAATGGAAGVALTYWVVNLLPAMMSRGRAPIVLDVALNARTLGFAALVTVGTILLFGLLPAVAGTRPDLQHGLKQSAYGGDRVRNTWARGMVATQVALLVVLVTSAGWFVRTLQNLRAVDAGFRPEQVLVVSVSAGPAYRGAAALALYEDLDARFSALPDVRSVSRSMDTPLAGEPSMSSTGIPVVGRPAEGEDAPRVYHNLVGPRFFETMGIPVLAGRDFEAGDDERAPRCVIVSESVARRYFPGEDPLGRQILFRGAPASIVGVVRDVRYTSLRAAAPLLTYRPYRQETMASANTFLIRTSSVSAEALTPLLQAQARAAAPALPPPSVAPLGDKIAGGLMEERMLATLSSALGVLAALLAAIGIHGTVASVAARRQREIGIRMALGAVPGRIARMVVRETFWIVAGGLAAGIASALVAAFVSRRLLAGVLFELSPADPLILSSAVLSILLIATLAAYVPARRASRIDPVAAVRSE
jgi:predicted permease